MDALLPFLAGTTAPLWDTPKGHGCLAEVVRRVRSCRHVDRVRVVTDRPDLFASSPEAPAFAPPPGDAGQEAASGALPRGTAWALGALAAVEGPPSGPLLAVDPRNPFLTPEVLDEAAARFLAEQAPLLLGAVRPEDHPCQFASLGTVVDAGLLLLFAERPESLPWLPEGWRGKVAVTRPLTFDWQLPDPPDAPTFHAPGALGLPERSAPALPPGPPPTQVLWVRVDSATVRLILPANTCAALPKGLPPELRPAPGSRILGANLLRRPGQARLLAWTEGSGSTQHVAGSRAGVPVASAALRLTPFGASGVEQAQPMTLDFPGQGGAAHAPSWPKECAGFVYTLFQDDEPLFYCPQPFTHDNELWRHDPKRGLRINVATGEPILGRQNFPELLRLDGSLAAGRAEDLLRSASLLRAGQAAVYLMEHEWSFQDDRLTIALLDATIRKRELPCP